MAHCASAMPTELRKASLQSRLSALIVTLLACQLWVTVGMGIALPEHDFLSFYTGATLAWRGQFYEIHDPAVQLGVAKEQVPELNELRPYIRTNLYAFLISPISLLPLDTAYLLWIGWHFLLLVVACIWAVRHFGWDALFFVCLNYPVGSGMLAAQDATWMLTVAIAGFTLAEKDRDFWSGAVLGLGLVKFHLWLFLLPAMLLCKRTRMALGYLSTAALMAAACLMLGGPPGITAHIRLLLSDDIRMLSPGKHTMLNVYAITSNFGLDSAWISVPLVLIVSWIAFLGVKNAPLWKWFAVASGGSLLVAPHVYPYDGTMFMLPLWLILYRSKLRVTRALAAVFSAPLVFWLFRVFSGCPADPCAVMQFLWDRYRPLRSLA